MKTTHRKLSIDMVIHEGIFRNNQKRLFPVLPSYLKHGLFFSVLINDFIFKKEIFFASDAPGIQYQNTYYLCV